MITRDVGSFYLLTYHPWHTVFTLEGAKWLLELQPLYPHSKQEVEFRRIVQKGICHLSLKEYS